MPGSPPLKVASPQQRAFPQQASAPAYRPIPPEVVAYLPGTNILANAVHDVFRIFERQFSKEPNQSFYSPAVSPANPQNFEIGFYEVPQATSLWLMDYEFMVYRFSGLDPGDSIKAEEGRYKNKMGFDLVINNTVRFSDISFELDPIPILQQRESFQQSLSVRRATPADYVRSNSRSYANSAGIGNALMPVRSQTMGGRKPIPFMVAINEKQRVALNCVVFRTITSPIVSVDARIAGFLLPMQHSEGLLKKSQP